MTESQHPRTSYQTRLSHGFPTRELPCHSRIHQFLQPPQKEAIVEDVVVLRASLALIHPAVFALLLAAIVFNLQNQKVGIARANDEQPQHVPLEWVCNHKV